MRLIARNERFLVALAAVALLGAPVAQADDLVALPAQPEGVAWPTTQWPEAAVDPAVDGAALARAV